MKPISKYISDSISSASQRVDPTQSKEEKVKEKDIVQGNYESRGKR